MSLEQAFMPNGQPAVGVAFEREDFRHHPEYIMGTVHVWVWRQSTAGKEILLQKRALTKETRPGQLDGSAAGHIDKNECAFDAAQRESAEEIGLRVDGEKLIFLFSRRKAQTYDAISTVYTYEAPDDFVPQLTDGEVAAVEWRPLTELETMTLSPREHNLAEHGENYYRLLLEYFKNP